MDIRLNALTDMSGPHDVFWTDKSKASIVVRFQERVEQVRKFFEKCRESLAMVNQTMFPLNPQPGSLLALMAKFRNPAEVRRLVRNQLIAGAEVALACVQAVHPTLNMGLVATANPTNLTHYYPLIEGPAAAIVDKLEKSTEAELLVRAEQRR